jgi:hypothetical protein
MTAAGREGGALAERDGWPALPYAPWADTLATLHRWTQMVGKTRLALSAPLNHWWHVPLYVTPRGLGTSIVPYGDRAFEAEFDFLDHQLVLRTSDGATRRLALAPRSVADFYGEYRAALAALGIRARFLPRPVEVVEAVPFAEDRVNASYDADAARRCWQSLVQADRVLKKFRGRFIGKASPVHFFWGGFDLACTRFSGRTAPPHPGGAPNVGVDVMREAYSHECSSAGWWPGGGLLEEPAFYSYIYPEPAGFAEARPGPEPAYYHRELCEFVLPYEAVRTTADPDGMVLEFLQATYDAAADHAGWDRAALERPMS